MQRQPVSVKPSVEDDPLGPRSASRLSS